MIFNNNHYEQNSIIYKPFHQWIKHKNNNIDLIIYYYIPKMLQG